MKYMLGSVRRNRSKFLVFLPWVPSYGVSMKINETHKSNQFKMFSFHICHMGSFKTSKENKKGDAQFGLLVSYREELAKNFMVTLLKTKL